jgi:hypothetical protein
MKSDGWSLDEPEPHVFLQWKGTDACLDFWCDCGFWGHFDGRFAYALRCPVCQKVWEPANILAIRPVSLHYDGVIQDVYDEGDRWVP